MKPTLPLSILSLCAFIIIGSFLLPVPTDNQQASIASAQSTPSFIITNQTVQTREGSSAAIKIKATTPVQATTKVCTTVSPDQGTTSRDYVKSSNTCVTFYKGGLSEKTLTVRTVRTQAEANKSLTVNISSTKVGTASTQRITPSATQTAKVLIADQKTAPGTILTGNNQNNNTNNNNNQNNNNTNLPPTNCAQYEGVIPGESRKVALEYRGWALQKYNYPISAEAQAQLNTMRGDLGNIQSFARGRMGGGFGRWVRESFPSGVVYAWPIKTTEYNDKVVIHIAGSENPETVEGNVIMSVSKCPGDFTSPQLLSQKNPGGERLPTCVGVGSAWGAGIGLVVTSGNPGGWTCDLEPNSQYYLNISAGFSKASPLENGMPTVSPGLGIGGRGNGTTWIFPGVQSADMIIYAQDYRGQGYTARPANGAPGLIKGKDAYYLENDRVAGIVAAALQQRVAVCRTLIASSSQPNRGVLGGGRECSGLGYPLPAYEWE